jgi:tRNA nucleotidyltransferase (CCA-adding enzyme)
MISPAVIKLCEAVRQTGGRALLVGGWVRDFLRRCETVDYDIEVYRIEPGRLRDGDRRFVVDVSLPRRESKTGPGHRGFHVEGDPSMSFQEAARRRDFTINSMMYDPLTREYLDYFGGREDLQRGIIRVVDPQTFVEDSLRVLRAMQFAARFEFTIDPATIDLCRTIDLSDLPAERIWAEVEKWLLQSNRPSIGLRAAHDLRIIDKLWPEVRALIDCPQDEKLHPEGDVLTHTAMTLDEACKLIGGLPGPKQITVMLAALCHDFGKPLTTRYEKEFIAAHNHERAGVAPAESFLERLKVFTFDHYDVRQQVLALVRDHLTPIRWYESQAAGAQVTDGMFRRLALRVEPDLLYRVELANRLGRGGNLEPVAEEWFIARVRELGIEERAPEPLLKGRHLLELGLEPGPRLGEIIREVYELQLDGEVLTLEEAVDAARKVIDRNLGAESH